VVTLRPLRSRIMAHAKIKDIQVVIVLAWLAMAGMSVATKLRLTEIFFQSKTTQITRSQAAVVITGRHIAPANRVTGLTGVHRGNSRSPRGDEDPNVDAAGPATPALTTTLNPTCQLRRPLSISTSHPKLSWRKHARVRFPAYPWEMECARYGASKSRS